MRWFILILLLSSCSSAWHFNRAVKKDPNIIKSERDTISILIPQYDTIWHVDTFEIQTTYTRIDTVLDVRVIEPKTRYQIRTEYKTHRDTIRLIRYVTRQEAKNERIKARNEVRLQRVQSRWWLWLVIGVALGVVVGRLRVL